MSRFRKICFGTLMVLFALSAAFAQDAPVSEDGTGGSSETMDEQTSYETRLEQYQVLLEESYIPSSEDLNELRQLSSELRDTPYIELSNRARTLLTIAEEKSEYGKSDSIAEKTVFTLPDYPAMQTGAIMKRNTLGMGITLGASFASIGLFNAFSFMSNIAYERYVSATNAENAALLQRTWMLYDILKYIFLGTGTVSFGASLPFFFTFGATELETDKIPGKLLETRGKLEQRLLRGEKNLPAWHTAGSISMGTGLTALIGAGISFGLAESAYHRYTQAIYSADAEEARNHVQLIETIGISAASLAAAGR